MIVNRRRVRYYIREASYNTYTNEKSLLDKGGRIVLSLFRSLIATSCISRELTYDSSFV